MHPWHNSVVHDVLVCYQYRVSLRDFMAAQLLHLTRHPRTVVRPALVVIPVVMLILVVLEQPLWANVIALALILVLQLGLLVALICLVFSLHWKHAYDSEDRWRQDISIELKDESVVMTMSDVRSELRWSAFREVVENDRFFLLDLSKRQLCIVPKRSIGVEGVHRLRTLGRQTHREGEAAC